MPEPVYFPTDTTRQVGHERRITRLERRPLAFIIMDHFKIFGDKVTTRELSPPDGAFGWHMTEDVLDSGLDIIGFRGYVTTPGDDCSMSLINRSTGATLVSLTIPGGEYDAVVTDEIDETLNYVEWVGDPGDRVPPEFFVETTEGGGTRGLGVHVYYGHDRRP